MRPSNGFEAGDDAIFSAEQGEKRTRGALSRRLGREKAFLSKHYGRLLTRRGNKVTGRLSGREQTRIRERTGGANRESRRLRNSNMKRQVYANFAWVTLDERRQERGRSVA